MISYDQVAEAAVVLTSLPDEFQRAIEGYGQKPLIGSRGWRELENCPAPEHLEAAHSSGVQSLWVGADHAAALARALSGEWLSYSPWACARAVLESCSVSSWLFDPDVGYPERVARSLNLRLRDLTGQIRYVKNESEMPEEVRLYAERRIEHLRNAAKLLGIAEKLARNGKFIGFSEGVPSHTEIIGAFDMKRPAPSLGYSLLSAAAHGESWAVRSLGSETIFGGSQAISVGSLRPEYAMLLIIHAVQDLSYPAWEMSVLFGWDLRVVESILNKAFDQVQIVEPLRFWNGKITPT